MKIDDRQKFEIQKREYAAQIDADSVTRARAMSLLKDCFAKGYNHVWDWMGMPIIQLPEVVMATQEIIFASRPDVIIETGIARGGSVVFSASMLELLWGPDKGLVIGVDIDIRAHNRESIQQHPMAKRIRMIEGSSTAHEVVTQITTLLPRNSNIMVVLDSNHTYDHVMNELKLYSPFVTPGQYMIVGDTWIDDLDIDENQELSPGMRWPWKKGYGPKRAVLDFLKQNDRFVRDDYMNGKALFSACREGFLKCIK